MSQNINDRAYARLVLEELYTVAAFIPAPTGTGLAMLFRSFERDVREFEFVG
jgi:hypothetical protein